MLEILKNVLQENAILTSEDDRAQFSINGQIPELILKPVNLDQISTIMKIAKRKNKKIMISGAHTQSEFGAIVKKADWILSLSQFNKIVNHDAADLTITVESGVTLPQLQSFIKTHHQFLPLDPYGQDIRTLGGIIATNSAGSLRLHYGCCRDLVLGIKVVLPDGQIIKAGGKTVKNVAGYDLSKLFIGSMGTLGVIAEITFKLSPVPANSKTIWISDKNLNKLIDFIKITEKTNLPIQRCEYLNSTFASEIFEYKPDTEQLHHLLINIAGHPVTVEDSEDKIINIISENNFNITSTFSDADEIKIWNKITNIATKLFIVKVQISVPKSKLENVVEIARSFSEKYDQSFAIHAHACNGIIYLYFNKNKDKSPDVNLIKNLMINIRNEIARYDGNMIVLKAPTEIRTAELVWGPPDQNFNLMKNIKNRYDTERRLVTGRYIGGL